MREYPKFELTGTAPSRPISFVTVRFSEELEHNLLTSPAVSDPLNELIVVDNRQNLFFDTLSQALINGINQAKHDLIAIVHEDVVLLDGWQQQLEKSLAALEEHDPNWALAGPIGWLPKRKAKGHVSDPHGYTNTF